MDSLMEIHETPLIYENHISSKFIYLFRWFDTKLQIIGEMASTRRQSGSVGDTASDRDASANGFVGYRH